MLNKKNYISNEEKFLYGFFLGVLIGLTLSTILRFYKQDYYISLLNIIIILCILVTIYRYEKLKNYDFAVLSLFWVTSIGIFIYIVYFGYSVHIFLAILIPLAGSILLNTKDFKRHGTAFLLIFTAVMTYGFIHKERYPYLNDTNFVIGFILLFFFLVAFSFVYHKSMRQSYIQLKKADQQKELLLKEIHHRVKNNLNIMISILGLQEEKYTSREILYFIQQNTLRIKSIALVHELLYQNDDFNSVDVESYIHNLTQHILSSSKKNSITLKVDANGIQLDINDIIYIGIMLNELITNTIKYAYPTHKGHIDITLERIDHLYRLSYKDYGKGINKKNLNSEGFGLNLIHLSAQQLDGHLTIEANNGFNATIHFEGTQALS